MGPNDFLCVRLLKMVSHHSVADALVYPGFLRRPVSKIFLKQAMHWKKVLVLPQELDSLARSD